jgi:hypothetical protein
VPILLAAVAPGRPKGVRPVKDVFVASGGCRPMRRVAKPAHPADAPAGHHVCMRNLVACLVRG